MSSRSDDLWSGAIFLAIASVFGITALSRLEIGTAGSMGPGYFAVMIALILATIAAILMVRSRLGESGDRRPVPWRGLVFVLSTPIAFALTVRTLGLVPALLATVALAALASRKISLVRGVVIVISITSFCVAVFSYGIGIPVELVSARLWP